MQTKQSKYDIFCRGTILILDRVDLLVNCLDRVYYFIYGIYAMMISSKLLLLSKNMHNVHVQWLQAEPLERSWII